MNRALNCLDDCLGKKKWKPVTAHPDWLLGWRVFRDHFDMAMRYAVYGHVVIASKHLLRAGRGIAVAFGIVAPVSVFKQFTFPLVRASFPVLDLKALVSVQPMREAIHV